MTTEHLIAPHGGTLRELLVSPERRRDLHEASRDWVSWDLTERQICDLELLLNGGFSPLTGFMNEDDFHSVCSQMRLEDGTLWPIPITLDVSDEVAERLDTGDKLALRDPEGVMVAALTVESKWRIDREEKAKSVFGTLDQKHPGVAHIFQRTNNFGIGGKIEGLQLPAHYDFVPLRLTPARLRRRFADRGWRRVVAFQTRNPMHRAQRSSASIWSSPTAKTLPPVSASRRVSSKNSSPPALTCSPAATTSSTAAKSSITSRTPRACCVPRIFPQARPAAAFTSAKRKTASATPCSTSRVAPSWRRLIAPSAPPTSSSPKSHPA